uniref:Pyrin domain-containing protein n=1 Tax=Cyprinodon variegatus TaxID=28743 RepID=A0A3Q2EIN0_CYPVA
TDMSTVNEQLLEVLEELLDEELETFQWHLYSKTVEGFAHIPKSKAKGLDRKDTVTLVVTTYGYDGAVTITIKILEKMRQKLLVDKLKEFHNSDLVTIQGRLKSKLKEKCQNIYEGNAEEGDNIYLKRIYTELHVITGAWGSLSDEREVRQQKSKQTSVEETINIQDLFKPRPNQEKRIRTVLTQGIPGMGKTVCAQKFTLSWAEGEEHQDITFLFPLPFRELNSIIGERNYTLMQLLHHFFPDIKPIQKLSECKVLFIFDGLDESRLPLDFKHNKVLRDETESALLDVLITNLIAGDLLGNALIWITSRPAAANKIPRKYIDQWTEMKGFTENQWQEYFKKRVRDDALSLRMINHVKSSKSLYVMCQIPIFCWITVKLMKKMLQDKATDRMPNTLTEMYAYLLLCQTDRMSERHYTMRSDNVYLKLAELAFRQLEKGRLIFYEADLKECRMDVNEATMHSGVCTEIFQMEEGKRHKVFSFVHLTIQEFLAAVFAHYSYMQNKDNVLLGRLGRFPSKLLKKSVFGFHKCAIEKALSSKTGQWDLFLRFLLGLSLKSNQELLYRILPLEVEGEEDVANTIQFIKDIISAEPEMNLNLFHCLGELREESLVQEIQSFVSSGKIASKQLSPAQWSALTFELMTSEALEKEFDLKKYIRSEEGVEKLLPVITSSTHALLDGCKLTENCCQLLASALSSTSSQLTDLDLSKNSLRDSGVRLLSDGLRSPHCKLKSLRLSWCGLTQKSCSHISPVLSTDCSTIRELDLGGNNLQGPGFSQLCSGLKSQNCKLETLRLNDCSLQKCGAEIASVLSTSSSQLKELDLCGNDLEDQGVELLSNGIANPNCVLETLRLSFCGVTVKGCTHLASALSSNPSHLRKLDLSYNFLQESGVNLISDQRDNPLCKLEDLRVVSVTCLIEV